MIKHLYKIEMLASYGTYAQVTGLDLIQQNDLTVSPSNVVVEYEDNSGYTMRSAIDHTSLWEMTAEMLPGCGIVSTFEKLKSIRLTGRNGYPQYNLRDLSVSYMSWDNATAVPTRTDSRWLPLVTAEYIYGNPLVMDTVNTGVSIDFVTPSTLLLFRNTLNEYFKLDGGTLVSIGMSLPTQSDFETHGVLAVVGADLATLRSVLSENQLTAVGYIPNSLDSDVVATNTTMASDSGIVIQTKAISLAGFNSITSFWLTPDSDTAKVAISKDGLDWYKLVDGVWTSIGALTADAAGISKLQQQGVSVTSFNSTTTEQINAFIGSGTELYLAMALDSTSNIEEFQLWVDGVGDWIKDTTATLKLRGSEFVLVPSTTDTYKVNYQDN